MGRTGVFNRDYGLTFQKVLGIFPPVGSIVYMYEQRKDEAGRTYVRKPYEVVKYYKHLVLCKDRAGFLVGFNNATFFINQRRP